MQPIAEAASQSLVAIDRAARVQAVARMPAIDARRASIPTSCVCWLLAGVLTYACVTSPLAAAEEPTENPMVAAAREARRQAETLAKVEMARLELVKQAMAHVQENKERAHTERQHVQLEIARIKQTQAARDWALQYLDVRQRHSREDEQLQSRTLQRWAHAREVARQRFMQLPERSRGAVRSGRALNLFLDLCGSTAINLGMYFQEVDEQSQLLEQEILRTLSEARNDPKVPTEISSRIPETKPSDTVLTELSKNDKLPKPLRQRFGDLDARRQLLAEKRRILKLVSGNLRFTQEQLANLRFTRGELGTKVTLRLAEEPMPLQWPYLLEVDPKYATYLKTIEATRKEALENLKAGKRASAQTADKLTRAVDELYNVFQQDRLKLYRLGRGGDFNNSVWRTSSFLKTLRSSAAYLIVARNIDDVALTKPYGVENAGTLLAYMMQHGLRFAPAEKLDEGHYQYTYRLLVDFYAGLDSLAVVLKRMPDTNRAELRHLRARERDLMDVEFQDTADAITSAISATSERGMAAKLSDMAEEVEEAMQDFASDLSDRIEPFTEF